MSENPQPVLVYDAECGFCSRCVEWTSTRWIADRRPRVVASQELDDPQLAALSLSRREVDRAAWWIDGARLFEGHLAVAKTLGACGGPWGFVGRALEHRPLRGTARRVYALVVRYRHVLSRSDVACRLVR